MTATVKQKENEWLRDEYVAYMRGTWDGRPMFVELFGPLIGLPEEWAAQGATPEEIELTAFGFDSVRRSGIRANTGFMNGQPETILEETDEYIIKRDSLGRRIKLCKGFATIPLPLEFPVTDMDSWLKLKPHYTYDESRFGEDWEDRAKAAYDRGALICVGIPGGFDAPRQLMGEEELCMAYYEQPELIHDMLNTMGETAERVLDRVSQAVPVQQLSVHEDMAGKSGSLIGPETILEFIKPYYRRIWDMLESRGCAIFDQDSDGDMNAVLDAFLECGINTMHPMEPAAGMDMVKVKETYGPRLSVKGGIDKHALRKGEDEIRRELEYKLQPSMRQGGVVFGLDHRIPNGVPIENYRYYVRTAREILGLPENPEPNWGRMAF